MKPAQTLKAIVTRAMGQRSLVEDNPSLELALQIAANRIDGPSKEQVHELVAQVDTLSRRIRNVPGENFSKTRAFLVLATVNSVRYAQNNITQGITSALISAAILLVRELKKDHSQKKEVEALETQLMTFVENLPVLVAKELYYNPETYAAWQDLPVGTRVYESVARKAKAPVDALETSD